MTKFHHIGLPTTESHPGEVYVSQTKVWVTDPRQHPLSIEFLRYEADSPVTGPLREQAHTAYRVDNLEEAIAGKEIILPPFSPSPGLRVAFVRMHGAVFEFMEYADEHALPWGAAAAP
ncbi:MAG: hypothetical protein QHJ73_03960 [Armatimonadota bacterium]|nr:hypothetical protein [Armatimonadota bacterium]